MRRLRRQARGRNVIFIDTSVEVTGDAFGRLAADGQLVKIASYPDLGTRIETFYRDGTLRSLTGTGVFPVRYEYGVEQDNGVHQLSMAMAF